ncbi:MAG: glycosyltransferase family 4 protein [Acidobacteria bacterium]|nr:glycosyltransferase family 4 protein [Acidobacteriota bacterium]
MRVLHLDTGKERRGGQIQLELLLEGLRGLGVESRVLAAARSEHAESAELTVGRLRAWSRSADLVHCHDARSHTLAALWARCPVVVSRRVIFPVKTGLLSKWKYGRPSLFLAISNAVACELLRAGVPERKVEIVPDGVRLPAEVSSRSGPLVALETDDPLKGRALLRATGLAIHYVRELEASFRTASAFLYITESEGLGSAALLAMAYGVPVIASRVGGLPEIVVHQSTGLLVNNHAVEIAAAAGRLKSDAELAARLAAAGRRMVAERFTFEQMARKTVAAYQRVVG